MPRFEYQRRDAKVWEEEANKKGGANFSIFRPEVKVYKPRNGDNWIRILPRTWNDDRLGRLYGIEVWQHRNIGPDRVPIICPRLFPLGEKHCPVCEARVEAERENRKDVVDALYAGRGYALYLLDRQDTKSDEVQAWTMGVKLYSNIGRVVKDRSTGEIYAVDDPDEGYNISFERTQQGGDARNIDYGAPVLDRKPSTVPNWALDYIQDNPLETMLLLNTYDEIKEIYAGAEPTDDRRGSRSSGHDDRGRSDDRRDSRREHDPRDDRHDTRRDPEPEPDARSARDREDRDGSTDRPARGRGADTKPAAEDKPTDRVQLRRPAGRGNDDPPPNDDDRGRGNGRDREPERRDERDSRTTTRGRDDDRGEGRTSASDRAEQVRSRFER